MKTLQFQTNINCGHCVKSVSGFLGDVPNIEWEVNTDDERKVLTVQGENITEKDIITVVEEAGFEIKVLAN